MWEPWASASVFQEPFCSLSLPWASAQAPLPGPHTLPSPVYPTRGNPFWGAPLSSDALLSGLRLMETKVGHSATNLPRGCPPSDQVRERTRYKEKAKKQNGVLPQPHTQPLFSRMHSGPSTQVSTGKGLPQGVLGTPVRGHFTLEKESCPSSQSSLPPIVFSFHLSVHLSVSKCCSALYLSPSCPYPNPKAFLVFSSL